MKYIIRQYVIDTFSLYLVSQIASGLSFQKVPESILLAGVGLMLASLLVKPIINVLLIPINLITFGLFKWVSSALALFLVIMLVPGFKIIGFHYAGLSTKWIDIPGINLGGILAIVAFSFLLSIITSFMRWLTK